MGRNARALVLVAGLVIAVAAGLVATLVVHSTRPRHAKVKVAPIGALDVDRPFGVGYVPAARFEWPVRPFDHPHVLRATFGEPRGLLDAGGPSGGGPARAQYLASIGQIAALGQRILHSGIDIVVADGTPVYALTSGTARTGGGNGYDRYVIVGGFGYWHLSNTVAVGTRVTAFKTILGYVYPGQGHVHLTRYAAPGLGEAGDDPVNPLLGGGISPYVDTAAPLLGAVRAFDTSQQRVPLGALKGPVVLAVNAVDVQSAGGTRTGVYSLGYRLQDASGARVLGPIRVFEFQVLPAKGVANRLYTVASTRHTFRTRFWYRITDRAPTNDGFLHTERLKPGVYRLEITAGDARGNVARRGYMLGVARP